jgi:protein O-GlcNAc transferase
MKSEGIEALVNRAVVFQKKGNLCRAGVIYRGLIRRNFCSARVLTNYGAISYQNGERLSALSLFEKALCLDPAYKDAWHNLRVDAETFTAAEFLQVADRILSIFPASKQARIASAQAYLALGNPCNAELVLQALLADSPDDLESLELIARCNLQSGNLDSATTYLLYIISLRPGDPFAATELAEIALKAGDSDSALQILTSALNSNSNSHELMFQLARFYQSGGRLYQAIDLYKKSMSLAPEPGSIVANLAYCYAEAGEVDEFLKQYEILLGKGKVTPENLMPLIFICSTLGLPFADRLRKYSELVWRIRKNSLAVKSLRDNVSDAPIAVIPVCSPPGLARKRVGVLTGDLGTHVVSSFLASFLLNYSKDVLDVEVVSSRWRNDPIAARLSASVDHCISIADFSESSARSLLAERQYDLILETSGFTSGTAIFLLDQRCAPVQCHWIGYHASTYLPTMDYFIGDSIYTPDALQGLFTEKIVTLPRAWLAATPFTAIPEAFCKSPQDEVVIGSFSQIAKLTEPTLTMWAQILSMVPHVKLLLKDKFVGDDKIQNRIIAFMNDFGINHERILFQPRTADWFQHMTLYNHLDLALDTTPWSSATTAFDALSMGVPLISLLGQTPAGRMSSSVLHHCGRLEWIASTPEQYVSKCLSIINDVQIHRKNKREYQSVVLRSQLYDGNHMAKAIEEFVIAL